MKAPHEYIINLSEHPAVVKHAAMLGLDGYASIWTDDTRTTLKPLLLETVVFALDFVPIVLPVIRSSFGNMLTSVNGTAATLGQVAWLYLNAPADQSALYRRKVLETAVHLLEMGIAKPYPSGESFWVQYPEHPLSVFRQKALALIPTLSHDPSTSKCTQGQFLDAVYIDDKRHLVPSVMPKDIAASDFYPAFRALIAPFAREIEPITSKASVLSTLTKYGCKKGILPKTVAVNNISPFGHHTDLTSVPDSDAVGVLIPAEYSSAHEDMVHIFPEYQGRYGMVAKKDVVEQHLKNLAHEEQAVTVSIEAQLVQFDTHTELRLKHVNGPSISVPIDATLSFSPTQNPTIEVKENDEPNTWQAWAARLSTKPV